MKEFLAQEHWEGTGNGKGEQDCGMSAANIMIGAGMALDVLWHDLDPEFREQYRKKCISTGSSYVSLRSPASYQGYPLLARRSSQ